MLCVRCNQQILLGLVNITSFVSLMVKVRLMEIEKNTDVVRGYGNDSKANQLFFYQEHTHKQNY